MPLLITIFGYAMTLQTGQYLRLGLLYFPTLILILSIVIFLMVAKNNISKIRQLRITLLYMAFLNGVTLTLWLAFFNEFPGNPNSLDNIPICPITLLDLILIPILFRYIYEVNLLFLPIFRLIYSLPLFDMVTNMIIHMPLVTTALFAGNLSTLMLLEFYPIYLIILIIYVASQYFLYSPFFLGFTDSGDWVIVNKFWCSFPQFLPIVEGSTETLTGFLSLHSLYFIQKREYHTTKSQQGLLDDFGKVTNELGKAFKPLSPFNRTVYHAFEKNPQAARFAARVAIVPLTFGFLYTVLRLETKSREIITKLTNDAKALDNEGNIIRQNLAIAEDNLRHTENIGYMLQERLRQADIQLEQLRAHNSKTPSELTNVHPSTTHTPIDLSDDPEQLCMIDFDHILSLFDLLSSLITYLSS